MTDEKDAEILALRGLCNRLMFGFIAVISPAKDWPRGYLSVANSMNGDMIYGWIRPTPMGTYAQAMGHKTIEDARDSAISDAESRPEPMPVPGPIRPSEAAPMEFQQAALWLKNQAAIVRQRSSGLLPHRALRRGIMDMEQETAALLKLAGVQLDMRTARAYDSGVTTT